MRVALSHAVLQQVDVHIREGSMALPNLTLTGSRAVGSSLVTDNGDLAVSLIHSTNVTYFQPRSQICFVAPSVVTHEETCFVWNTTTPVLEVGSNTTTESVERFTSCRGTALLCSSQNGLGSDCSGSGLAMLHAQTRSGGVHVSVVGGMNPVAAVLADPNIDAVNGALQVSTA